MLFTTDFVLYSQTTRLARGHPQLTRYTNLIHGAFTLSGAAFQRNFHSLVPISSLREVEYDPSKVTTTSLSTGHVF